MISSSGQFQLVSFRLDSVVQNVAPRHRHPHFPAPRFLRKLLRSGIIVLLLLLAGWLALISPTPVHADTTANAETERIVTLQEGYNLVVYTGPTVEARGLPVVIPSLTRVWRWDARSQQFDVFSPGAGFSLDRIGSIHSGDALWVTVNESSQWRMPVLSLTPFVTLYDGWNLAPWVGDDGLSPEAVFQTTLNRLGAAYSWGPEIGEFLAFSPTLLPTLNSLKQVAQFDGLWLRITAGPPVAWQQLGADPASAVPLVGAESVEDSAPLLDSSAVARSVVLIDSSDTAGSGFVIDGGLVVTAAHVVGSAEWLTVWFSDGQHRRAKVTAINTTLDIAIARVTDMPDTVVALDWESAPTPPLTEEVWVWGYPVERTVISAGFSRAPPSREASSPLIVSATASAPYRSMPPSTPAIPADPSSRRMDSWSGSSPPFSGLVETISKASISPWISPNTATRSVPFWTKPAHPTEFLSHPGGVQRKGAAHSAAPLEAVRDYPLSIHIRNRQRDRHTAPVEDEHGIQPIDRREAAQERRLPSEERVPDLAHRIPAERPRQPAAIQQGLN
jgi:hypothetical protein